MQCLSSCGAGPRLAQVSSVRVCSPSSPAALPFAPSLRSACCRPAPSRLVVRMGSSGKFFVGGNWKSNGTKESVNKLVQDLNAAEVSPDVEVIVAPTFIHLQHVVEHISPPYQVSAQNCWVGKAGAFTGEVSGTPPSLHAAPPAGC